MDRNAGKISPPPGATGSSADGVNAAEFVEYLRGERERRSLTLEQIADETKIASRHLAALERGDVRNWPGGMYRRAMMRAYADSIGVDREFALKQFERAFDQRPAVDHPPAPSVEPVRQLSLTLPSWRPSRAQLTIAIGSLVLAAVVWIGWRVAANLTARSESPETVAAAPVPIPVSAPTPTEPANAQVATSGLSDPQPIATEGSLVVVSEPAGARVTVDGIGWGETPITIRHLPLGEKRVRLTMQGYVSQERAVRLGADRPNATVRLALREREL